MTEPQPPRPPEEPDPVDATPTDGDPVDPDPTEPPSVEPAAPDSETVGSFAAEPPVEPETDPTPEVPATSADEPPDEPAAEPPAEPAADPPPLGAGTPDPPAPYEADGDVPEPAPSAQPAGLDEPAPPLPTEPLPLETGTPETVQTLALEEEAAAEPLPAAEPAPAPPPGPRRSRAWIPVAAVGLSVALLAGATGYLAWQLRQSSVAEDGRSEAVAAARDAARLLFSYDHDTLEEDFAQGLAVTTGAFREEYSRTTSEVVTPVAEQYDAVVVAEVVEAAVIDASPGEVTALVFLNQATTSTRVQGQQVDQSRVRMHLVERDGRWLVEAVDAL